MFSAGDIQYEAPMSPMSPVQALRASNLTMSIGKKTDSAEDLVPPS